MAVYGGKVVVLDSNLHLGTQPSFSLRQSKRTSTGIIKLSSRSPSLERNHRENSNFVLRRHSHIACQQRNLEPLAKRSSGRPKAAGSSTKPALDILVIVEGITDRRAVENAVDAEVNSFHSTQIDFTLVSHAHIIRLHMHTALGFHFSHPLRHALLHCTSPHTL